MEHGESQWKCFVLMNKSKIKWIISHCYQTAACPDPQLLSYFFLFSYLFCLSCESVLYKAGPWTDEGDGHRLWVESHLRHIRQTWKQSGWLQHAVSLSPWHCVSRVSWISLVVDVIVSCTPASVLSVNRTYLQIFRCDGGGLGERHHQSERRSGCAAQYVQCWIHPHRTQSGERSARSEGTLTLIHHQLYRLYLMLLRDFMNDSYIQLHNTIVLPCCLVLTVHCGWMTYKDVLISLYHTFLFTQVTVIHTLGAVCRIIVV